MVTTDQNLLNLHLQKKRNETKRNEKKNRAAHFEGPFGKTLSSHVIPDMLIH